MRNAFQKATVSISIIAIIGFMAFALSGCATVSFYSDPALTAKTGLKFYTLRPYLQVERADENPRDH